MQASKLGDIPIGPAMRHMRSDIKQGCPVDLENWPDLSNITDPSERKAQLRRPLYILGGLITPFAVRQLIDMKTEQSPQGLVRGPIAEGRAYSPDNPEMQSLQVKTFSGLHKGLRNAARLTMNTLSIPKEYGGVAARFNQLVDEARKIEPNEPRYETPKRFILAGLFTAIEMNIGAQSGISTLANTERHTTGRQEYIDITDRSVRLVTSVAALNIDHTDPFRRAAISHSFPLRSASYSEATPYFNPNILTFQGDPDASDAWIDYIKPVGKLVDPLTGKRIEDIETEFETLTCLGLPVGENGASPIKEFWQYTGRLAANAIYSE